MGQILNKFRRSTRLVEMEKRAKRKASKPNYVDLTEESDNEYDHSIPVKRKRKVQDSSHRKIIEAYNLDVGKEEATSESYTQNNKDEASVYRNDNGTLKEKRPWDVHELLAEIENIDERSSRNIVNLFENENTIPFICRYRRDMISNDIDPEKMRSIKITYGDIINMRKRADNYLKTLERDGQLTSEINEQILYARTVDELEFLYAPYKPAKKGTLAERARVLGLEPYAEAILSGAHEQVHIRKVIDLTNAELDTEEKVATGICHIISHIISKSTVILEELKRLQKFHKITLNCTKTKQTKTKENEKAKSEEMKYENYFDFEANIEFIKPHQILAINRGESQKILSVKFTIPNRLKENMKDFVKKLYLQQGNSYSLRTDLFEKSFEDCFTKKLQPFLCRQLRAELNEKAAKASVDVFARNLKQLLLTSPLKGENILGIDPGFSNGCKIALISKTADVLETTVLYPHRKSENRIECGKRLAAMLKRHGCTLIALGNGTACRETEKWISELFQSSILNEAEIRYSIVSEQGASIYSCSEVAKKEFPDMDVNLISAVSIARRLNDPLSEYVKVEPKHIGVGMYQHDIREKLLLETLGEVVTECVSFVGVDINTASFSLLRSIAGLNSSRAEKIIDYRMKNGPFQTRKDLLNVKSIGEKTFQQCAGFVRIEPLSIGGEVENLLDCTWVHPESYTVTERIIKKSKQMLKNVGKPDFVNNINNFRMTINLEELAKELKTPKERIISIFEALQRPLLSDIRNDVKRTPLFKKGITKMTELRQGTIVSGSITNITHFGAFVDIGVEKDGLIHSSQLKGAVLNIGDHVDALVMHTDVERQRIQLSFKDFSK